MSVRAPGDVRGSSRRAPPSLDSDMEKHAERREPTVCSRRTSLTLMEEKKRVRESYCKKLAPTFAPRPIRYHGSTFDVRH